MEATAPLTAAIARAMNIPLPKDCTGEEAAAICANHIKVLLRSLKIPSLKQQGISREAAVDCAKDAYEKAFFIVYTPRKITIPELAKLIGQMYDEYQ